MMMIRVYGIMIRMSNLFITTLDSGFSRLLYFVDMCQASSVKPPSSSEAYVSVKRQQWEIPRLARSCIRIEIKSTDFFHYNIT